MKKIILVLTIVLVCLCVIACLPVDPTTGPFWSSTAKPTDPPTNPPTVLTGWQETDGRRYYYDASGTMTTGWQEIDGHRYYFGADGVLCTGWQEIDGVPYYFNMEGIPYTGWVEKDGNRYYFDETGKRHTGWLDSDGVRYYLNTDGIIVTGWQQIGADRCYFLENGALASGWQDIDGVHCYLTEQGTLANGWQEISGNRYYFAADGTYMTGWIEADAKRYYLGEDGIVVTGWLQMDGKRYYLKEDGAMARGMVEIDGVRNFFTSSGDYILVLNPWNSLPEGFEPELVTLDKYNGYSNMLIEKSCYDALVQMLADCKKQCQKAYVVSSYRTMAFQTKNYNRKVTYYLNQGYSQEEAEILAAKVVAVPGTSEHQSGLAVDIVDAKLWSLEEEQADMPAQKWLMENSWKYGFILRYPKDKTDVTGIIYEPWHYRYVGLEVAKELYESGLTLEEYLDQLTAEEAAK